MHKPNLPEITYMRGLCMLGVIGIHVGSFALSNEHANLALVSFLEILTRFTVPAFFFLSALGLFYHTSVEDEFSYKDFIKRRLKVVVYPYLAWSFLYLAYNSVILREVGSFFPQYLWKTLFYGTAMYQLYFMVILIWFYLFMPLWRWLVRLILKAPIPWLIIGFFLQMAFNFWSSYEASQIHFTSELLDYAFSMRLNYWVGHYVWIFLLGAVIAERYETVMAYIGRYGGWITALFALSLALMIGSYYYVIDVWHYTALEAVFTVHQLSPMGLFYTLMGCVFFLWAFRVTPMSESGHAIWDGLGRASYGMYLIHPFMLILITWPLHKFGYTYTVPVTIGLYIVIICTSYLSTYMMERFPQRLSKILLGK